MGGSMVQPQQRHEWKPLGWGDIEYDKRRIDVDVFLASDALTTVPAYGSPDWEENWIPDQIAKLLVGIEEERPGGSFGERGYVEYDRSIRLAVIINGESRYETFRILKNADNLVQTPRMEAIMGLVGSTQREDAFEGIPMLIGRATIRAVWGDTWPPTHLAPSRAHQHPHPPRHTLPPEANEHRTLAPYQVGIGPQISDPDVPPNTSLGMYDQAGGSLFGSTEHRSWYANTSGSYPDAAFGPIVRSQAADPVTNTTWSAGTWCTWPEPTHASAAGFSSAHQAGAIPVLIDSPDEQPLEGNLSNWHGTFDDSLYPQ